MIKNKTTKEQDIIRNLRIQNIETSNHITSLQEDAIRDAKELHYLNGFLEYHRLEEAYRYFKENAYEVEDEDMPFSRLTL